MFNKELKKQVCNLQQECQNLRKQIKFLNDAHQLQVRDINHNHHDFVNFVVALGYERTPETKIPSGWRKVEGS